MPGIFPAKVYISRGAAKNAKKIIVAGGYMAMLSCSSTLQFYCNFLGALGGSARDNSARSQVARNSSNGFCLRTDSVARRAVATLSALMARMVKTVIPQEKLHRLSNTK